MNFRPIFRYLPYLLIITVFCVLRWMDFDGFHGQDSYEYLRLARNIQDQWLNGAKPTDAIYPPGFPVLGAAFGLVVGSVEWGLSLASLFFAFLCCWFFQRILDLLYPGKEWEKSFFTLFVLVLCPAFMKASQIPMSDMAALSCFMGLIWVCLSFDKNPRNGLLLLAALFTVLAISTRIATLVIIPFPIFFLAWKSIEKRKFFALIGGALLFGFLLFILFQFSTSFGKFNAGHPYSPDHWNFLHIFQKEFHSKEGNALYTLPNFIFVTAIFYHKAFQFWGVIYLIFTILSIRERPQIWKLLWLPIGVYLLFMAGLSVQNERYLLLVFPLSLILIFPGFARVFEIVKSTRYWIPVLLVHLASQLYLNFRSLRGPFHLSAFEKNLAMDLQPYRQRKIYSFSVDVSLKQRIPGIQIYNMWAERFTQIDPNALVLFNVPAFEKAWKNQNPMINWDRLNQHKLVPVKLWPNGWVLYEIN